MLFSLARRSLGQSGPSGSRFLLDEFFLCEVIIKPHWGNTWETIYIYMCVCLYVYVYIYIYIRKSQILLRLLRSDPQVNRMQYDHHSGGPVSAINLSLCPPGWPPTLHASSSLPVSTILLKITSGYIKSFHIFHCFPTNLLSKSG